jgi:hypothetical protein
MQRQQSEQISELSVHASATAVNPLDPMPPEDPLMGASFYEILLPFAFFLEVAAAIAVHKPGLLVRMMIRMTDLRCSPY